MSSAWKVAYADFVTALMAFFLLMWILNMTPPETKEGLASYFAQEALLDASNVSAISNNALINRTDKLDLSESKMSELERSHYLIARKLQTMLMQDGIPQSASGLSADDVGVQLRISNDAPVQTRQRGLFSRGAQGARRSSGYPAGIQSVSCYPGPC